MRKFLQWLAIVLTLAVPVLLFADSDTQWWESIPISAGRIITTETVNPTTSTAIALNTQAFYDSNMDIFNNSAFTLWIGTNAATNTLQTVGFPILSSKTYTLNGRFTGIVYGTEDSSAAGNGNVRVIHWSVK